MSNKSARGHQSRKKEKARARARTMRERNQGRTALRVKKAAGQELENTEPSQANIAFAEGLPAYRSFRENERLQLLAEKVYEVYKKAPKNKFYVRVGDRPISTLEFARRVRDRTVPTQFDILYKGNDPSQDFYFDFYEDEDENNETHRVRYYYIGSRHAPFLYFINQMEDKLDPEDMRLLYTMWDDNTEFAVDIPLRFLTNFSLSFKKALNKALLEYSVYLQKKASVKEKALSTLGALPENVEARIRSMISSKPYATNYSGTVQNFSQINTSLFN